MIGFRYLIGAALYVLAATVFSTGSLTAQEVQRNARPGSSFPISQSAFVPAGAEILFVSGHVPPLVNEEAPRASIEAYGDITTQTVGVLNQLDQAMQSQGWKLADAIMMRVYLTPDPSNDGRMDFQGFMKGYSQFFGTEAQPNKPARVVMQVGALANPGWLVEIEVQAARMPGQD